MSMRLQTRVCAWVWVGASMHMVSLVGSFSKSGRVNLVFAAVLVVSFRCAEGVVSMVTFQIMGLVTMYASV